MNLADVMDDLGAALKRINGLRVFPYSAENVSPPAAVVLWPEELAYDTTMVRGGDRLTVPVLVLAGQIDARSTRDVLARYLDGVGQHSVKAALEGYGDATSYDSLRVVSASVTSAPVAGVELLGAQFQVDIIGKGSS